MEPESGDVVWPRAAVGREKEKDHVGHGPGGSGSAPDVARAAGSAACHGIVDGEVVGWCLHGVRGHDSMKNQVQEPI